jgi:hypothetical protein
MPEMQKTLAAEKANLNLAKAIAPLEKSARQALHPASVSAQTAVSHRQRQLRQSRIPLGQSGRRGGSDR